MKKLLFTAQFTLFLAFNFFLLLAAYQFFGSSSYSAQNLSYSEPVYDQAEEFDPSLQRLNSMSKLSAYCDSVYHSEIRRRGSVPESFYPELASAVIRKRFYHGYSVYGLNSNYMAVGLSRMIMSGLSAIVVPDDILKYPYAACSQQSIITMELLREKGYDTRKVGLSGNITGHFTFEAYYQGGWHYYDTDKEPDAAYLNAYNRPSIAYLNAHPDMLVRAYPQYSKAYIMDVFTNYSYGGVNEFPAEKAIIFQYVTKFLSYTLWSFFLLAFVFVRKKYKQYGLVTSTRKRRRMAGTPVPVPVCSPA